ncbi:hypothetical protein BD309DRAFT_945572 [Dichomitus squalens]|nr:hypothetical protein BD309DRAFT_945572 [Dichomitus squalens]
MSNAPAGPHIMFGSSGLPRSLFGLVIRPVTITALMSLQVSTLRCYWLTLRSSSTSSSSRALCL